MNKITFYAICEDIKKNSNNENPEIIIVTNAISSHGGYSSGNMEFRNIKLDDITIIEGVDAIRFRIPAKKDRQDEKYFMSVSVLENYFKEYAYVYLPLENIVCMFLTE